MEIAVIALRNPVLLDSRTCNYGQKLQLINDLSHFGGIVTKTVNPLPRAGNRPQRVVETPAGVLDSIGLQNPRLHDFVENKWPFLESLGKQIVVNISGHTIEEFADIAARLQDLQGIAALEVNIFCLNVKADGTSFANSPSASAEVIGAVRRATQHPIIAKLSPNVTDIAEIACAAEDAGVDALSLINAFFGVSTDVPNYHPLLGSMKGSLSGPEVKPVALAMIWKVAQAARIPLIILGGICAVQDAVELIIFGASAVHVGTVSFVNPNAGVEIVEGIRRYGDECSINEVSQLIGLLQT